MGVWFYVLHDKCMFVSGVDIAMQTRAWAPGCSLFRHVRCHVYVACCPATPAKQTGGWGETVEQQKCRCCHEGVCTSVCVHVWVCASANRYCPLWGLTSTRGQYPVVSSGNYWLPSRFNEKHNTRRGTKGFVTYIQVIITMARQHILETNQVCCCYKFLG